MRWLVVLGVLLLALAIVVGLVVAVDGGVDDDGAVDRSDPRFQTLSIKIGPTTILDTPSLLPTTGTTPF
jgi:hypothetical protein